jgi:hypothetical protein
MNVVKASSILGTGAAITVVTGWTPDYVKLFNFSDAAALFATLEWFNGMPAASALKTLKSIDSGVTGNASSTLITVGGITLWAGSSTLGKGFIIGTDVNLNVAGQTFSFLALRGTDGAFAKQSVAGVYVA